MQKRMLTNLEVIGDEKSMNYYTRDRFITTDHVDIPKLRQEE